MSAPLILALPSKGRLQEQTTAFLADCGLPLSLDGGARGYVASIAALPGVVVRLVSAGEIVGALLEGSAHLGVTGEDLLREARPSLEGLTLVKPLGFGRADLVVAAPRAWLDVDTMADFAEVCAERRVRTGDRLRVATKYMALARRFFAERGIVDYRLVESAGATEGAPAAGDAEAIVDITTTGATLAANHLKPLADGVILRSQAQLAASRTAAWDGSALATLRRLLDVIEARARAHAVRIVRAAPPADPAVRGRLTALSCRPIGSDGEGDAAYYCPVGAVFEAAAILSEMGASVSVSRPDYVFEPTNALFDAAAPLLKAP